MNEIIKNVFGNLAFVVLTLLITGIIITAFVNFLIGFIIIGLGVVVRVYTMFKK